MKPFTEKEKRGWLIGLPSVIAATAIGIMSMGKKVYSGDIDGWSIDYHEGIFTFMGDGSEITKNRMYATKGDLTYIFIDSVNETSIFDKNFEEDHLEMIIERNGDAEEEHVSKIVNGAAVMYTSGTPQDFENKIQLYNTLRTKLKLTIKE